VGTHRKGKRRRCSHLSSERCINSNRSKNRKPTKKRRLRKLDAEKGNSSFPVGSGEKIRSTKREGSVSDGPARKLVGGEVAGPTKAPLGGSSASRGKVPPSQKGSRPSLKKMPKRKREPCAFD